LVKEYLIENKQKLFDRNKFNQLLKKGKDAIALLKTDIIHRNPSILAKLETFKESPHFNLLEALNVVIFDMLTGISFYQFGQGFEHILGVSTNLMGGYMDAFMAILYTETKDKFDSIVIQDFGHNNALSLILFRTENYFLLAIHTPRIQQRFNKTITECQTLLREMLLALPEYLR